MEQGYCRRCGQSFFGIQQVLDGRIAELQTRLETAEKWIKAGNATLIAFISIALTISVLGIAVGAPVLSIVAMIKVLLGVLIGFPFLFIGYAQLTKAKRLVSQLPAGPEIQGRSGLTMAQTTRLPQLINEGSVTEHTTLRLSPPESAQRSRRDE